MTVATGTTGIAQETAKNLLADCATFRTWVGAAGADAQEQARNRIHLETLPEPDGGEEYTLAELQKLRPFALIGSGGDGAFTATRSSTAGGYGDGGTVLLHLEQDVPPPIATLAGEIDVRFRNTFDAILAELFEEARGVWLLRDVSLIDGPTRNEARENPTQGDAIYVRFALKWGTEQT